MPSSKQTPLTAPRGGQVHDFTQSYQSWEVAVFDRADHFLVVELRAGRRATVFSVFPWAVMHARRSADTGACVYAVASGRSVHIDREKWDEWIKRWREEGSGGIRQDD